MDDPTIELSNFADADSVVEKEKAWWTLQHWMNPPRDTKPKWPAPYGIGQPVVNVRTDEVVRVIGFYWDAAQSLWMYAVQGLKDIQTEKNVYHLARQTTIIPFRQKPKLLCISR